MSRYEELENFVRIVEAGSITAAASQMRIAKSAVSRRLKELEARLGTQLLKRSTRKLVLTDSGQALYQRAIPLLSDWEETEAEASEDRTGLKGRLRISAPLSFGIAHLSPTIIDFMTHHPRVQIDVDYTDRFVDLTSEGFDIALRIGNLSDSTLVARKLANISTVVVASPDLIEKSRPPKRPNDLSTIRECTYGHRTINAWHYTGPDGSRGEIELETGMIATNGELLRDAAVAGLGVLKIPRFIVYKNIKDGSLIELLPDYRWEALALYAVYPPTRYLSARARAYIDFLAERFKGTPYWDEQ